MSKNGLTNQNYSDRIIKLSRDSAQQNKSRKKLEKSLKKYLTREKFGDIITKLSARAGGKLDLEN